MTDTITLPRAVGIVLEGFTLTDAARKILETAYFADVALAQQAEQGWVSINDGLPQPHQMVLVARGKFVTTGSYSPAFGWEWEQLDGEDDDAVATHWMAIPAAPKGQK